MFSLSQFANGADILFFWKSSPYWLKPTQYFTPFNWWRVYHFRESVYNRSYRALCSAEALLHQLIFFCLFGFFFNTAKEGIESLEINTALCTKTSNHKPHISNSYWFNFWYSIFRTQAHSRIADGSNGLTSKCSQSQNFDVMFFSVLILNTIFSFF